MIAELRARVEVPLMPMTYASPVMAYGAHRFCADAAAAGANGLIVPDVPLDEAGELLEGCRGRRARPGAAAGADQPRVADRAGLPGGRRLRVPGLGGRHHRCPRGAVDAGGRPGGAGAAAHRLPLLIGFGISSPSNAREALETGADGVIIGSKAIEVCEEGGAPALEAFVREIAETVRPSPRLTPGQSAAAGGARRPLGRDARGDERNLRFAGRLAWLLAAQRPVDQFRADRGLQEILGV